MAKLLSPLLLLFVMGGCVADEGVRYPKSRDEPVITLSYVGSFTGETLEYSFYGDGRFEYELKDQSESTLRSGSNFVAPDELAELVELAIRSGLADISSEVLTEHLAGRKIADGSRVTFRFSLLGYGPRSDLSQTISVTGPEALLRYHPDVSELHALVEIGRRARSLEATAVND